MYSHLLTQLALLAFVVAPSPASAQENGMKRTLTAIDREYDYIVVGGGTSGLVVANRLSANQNVTVLVVEFGDVDDTWNTALPYNATTNMAWLQFNYTSTPQPGLFNRTSPLSVAATVGGGSSINAMLVDRGSKPDYDAWEELGNPGWGWDGLLPYFRKATTFTPPPQQYVERYNYTWNRDAYGDGPVQVTFPSWQWPDYIPESRAWTDEFKLKYMGDGSVENNVGLLWVPQSTDPATANRSSSRTAYFVPASSRANLDLLVKHYVSTIEFNDTTATGVQIISRDNAVTNRTLIKARKEVIMAAGAINTARTLQLSGVGPANLLQSLGIKIVVDSPGVGANFQDHPTMITMFNFTKENPINANNLRNQSVFNAAWEEYRKNHTGPLTQGRTNNMIFLSLKGLTSDYESISSAFGQQNATDYLPDNYHNSSTLLAGYLAQRKILQNRFLRDDAGVMEVPFAGLPLLITGLEKPVSRGRVMISRNADAAGADPVVSPPLIDFGTLINPIDAKIAVLAFRAGRRMFQNKELASLGPVELSPGEASTGGNTDVEIETVLRRQLVQSSFAHPSGTTAMMPRDLGGVVDPQLRVYGTKGLRVVDASIIPLIPASHMQWTVYAVAEKAAELIQQS